MELEQLDEKPIRLKLKSGHVLLGAIQLAAAIPGNYDLIPFLTIEKRRELRDHLGISDSTRLLVPITIEQIREFLEFIPQYQVQSYEVVETEVHSLRLVTQNGREIQVNQFQVQLKVLDTPGLVKATIRIPNHDKLFDVGELAIKNGTIEIPVSVAFISYAREDEKIVAEISRKLNDNGVVTWFDKRNLMPGDDWEMRIEQGIEKADYFLLFTSRQTEDKIGYKNREIQLALKQQSYRPRGKTFIIPILLDDCDPLYDLRNLNWLKLTDESWFEKLVRTIAPWYVKRQFFSP
jgi:TIR domain